MKNIIYILLILLSFACKKDEDVQPDNNCIYTITYTEHFDDWVIGGSGALVNKDYYIVHYEGNGEIGELKIFSQHYTDFLNNDWDEYC